MQRYCLIAKIHKSSDMLFFSQLDLVRIFERALRRTSLPLYFTQGFNPHVKLSFSHALKLGQEGVIEVKFYFREKIDPPFFLQELEKQIPSGIRIMAVTI